jgi:hypothetical protein
MTRRLSPAIDVMRMELWSLPMAAAWMIWRTEDAVRGACPAANGYTSRPDLFELFAQACDPDLLPLMEGAKAQIEFWAPMHNGRIKAAGVPSHASVRILIPADEWPEFSHLRLQNGHPEAIGTLDEVRYKDVVVPRNEVMAVWPLIEPPSDHEISNQNETACRKRLIEVMAQSPNKPTMTNKALLSQARETWPTLGDNQFKRAKAAAVNTTGALAWGSGGAPLKNKT